MYDGRILIHRDRVCSTSYTPSFRLLSNLFVIGIRSIIAMLVNRSQRRFDGEMKLMMEVVLVIIVVAVVVTHLVATS